MQPHCDVIANSPAWQLGWCLSTDGAVKHAAFRETGGTQVGGKLLVATTGGSPLKPSEVALLEVADVAALKASGPGDWQTLQRSSKAQVHPLLAPHRAEDTILLMALPRKH